MKEQNKKRKKESLWGVVSKAFNNEQDYAKESRKSSITTV